MSIITRFAPSPTGFLHIGSARTALFNWLLARRHGGQFLLRIEDTDRVRSTQAAVDAIFDGLTWLGLDWDGDAVSQFERRERHATCAHTLLESGHAYYCFATSQELEQMRELAKTEGRAPGYDGRWRDRDPADAPAGVAPTIRLKAPRTGETTIRDAVQGQVTIANNQLDDMVLLRSDGTPTYMLAVVVDDHDMGITDVLRGDDHFNNAFRQAQLYHALSWDLPRFAHLPLIHGADGAKLSKRHGALGVEAYREMGYLPEAVCNYLLRLGWSHGDDEIISRPDAIAWFGTDALNRAPSRLDPQKLAHVNATYLRKSAPERLWDAISPALTDTGHRTDAEAQGWILALMPHLTPRAKTIPELADAARPVVGQRLLPLGQIACNRTRESTLDAKAAQALERARPELKAALRTMLMALDPFTETGIDTGIRALATEMELKLGQVAPVLRAALCGTMVSPPVSAVAEALGKDEVLARLDIVF
jgi:glutamyl-tRNA synthetase